VTLYNQDHFDRHAVEYQQEYINNIYSLLGSISCMLHVHPYAWSHLIQIVESTNFDTRCIFKGNYISANCRFEFDVFLLDITTSNSL
jgi:hypothetical protein